MIIPLHELAELVQANLAPTDELVEIFEQVGLHGVPAHRADVTILATTWFALGAQLGAQGRYRYLVEPRGRAGVDLLDIRIPDDASGLE